MWPSRPSSLSFIRRECVHHYSLPKNIHNELFLAFGDEACVLGCWLLAILGCLWYVEQQLLHYHHGVLQEAAECLPPHTPLCNPPAPAITARTHSPRHTPTQRCELGLVLDFDEDVLSPSYKCLPTGDCAESRSIVGFAVWKDAGA